MNYIPTSSGFKQTRGGGGGGGCFVKQWRTQQQNVLENPQHPLLKQAPGRGGGEKTFSACFVPQPAENNTSHTPLGAAAAIRRNYTTIESVNKIQHILFS